MQEEHGLSKEELKSAILRESKNFERTYLWLEEHMPKAFFEEVDADSLLLVTHNLMSLHLQDYFSRIHTKHSAIVLCPDSPEADMEILKGYEFHGIRYYRTFLSNSPFPGEPNNRVLRIAVIIFTEAIESPEESLSEERKQELLALVKARNPQIKEEEFSPLLQGLTNRFLRSMTIDRLTIALDTFFRAQHENLCQYEVRYHEDWKEKESPSMQIILSWRNVPKYKFLYRLAQVIYRHNLDMQRVIASYIDPYSTDSVLILSLALHGQKGEAAWDAADIPDFLRELVTLKYFDNSDLTEKMFVARGLIKENQANLLRSMISFVHQILVNGDPYLYSISNIEEGFCRHPELTKHLLDIFELKFHPEKRDQKRYDTVQAGFLRLVDNIDTGHQVNDIRRKNILKQGLNFIEHTLKTNYYRTNKSSFSFRLDPNYLLHTPFDLNEKFPEIPYGIFFIKNAHFMGFHIRFKDLSRGGLRTVIPEKVEQFIVERNNIFSECYNLAYTQHKKNKDIPEGGSKAVILLEPFDRLYYEPLIYKKELQRASVDSSIIEEKLKNFRADHKKEYLYQAQRSFISSFLMIINCDIYGTLKAKEVIDYLNKPEYIYLGPDENMHNCIIEWIAALSAEEGYIPGKSFITSKPSLGINHKEFGVTSLGVKVYLEETLHYLGIDPQKDPFTIKISGGPDGDVAGNLILNLLKYYPKTAKLLALVDISGTIFDPDGLDLNELAKLFHEAKPIASYPPERLSDQGFLLDLTTKKEQTAFIQQTLCWKKESGKLTKEWLSGDEMNHLFRHNVHQVKSDLFVPGGGRPRTLSENNYRDFLDETGIPTSKAIIEAANLYLTPKARRALEKEGVLIIKDSSANKGGVICSSFEVLSTLVLTEEEFQKEKKELVEEILEILQTAARNEAKLLLDTLKNEGGYLTDISEKISRKINTYKYELLDYLTSIELSKKTEDPLTAYLIRYAPPLISSKYQRNILEKLPEVHKKAIIACSIASNLIYVKGLNWSPSIVDVLPLISRENKPLEEL